MERSASTESHEDYVLGLNTALQKFDLTPEEIDALRKWDFSRPVWLEQRAAVREAEARRCASEVSLTSVVSEELTISEQKVVLTHISSVELKTQDTTGFEPASIHDPKQFHEEITRASPRNAQLPAAAPYPPESSLDASAADRPFDVGGPNTADRTPHTVQQSAPLPSPDEAVQAHEPERTRAQQLWAKVRTSVVCRTFLLRLAVAIEEGYDSEEYKSDADVRKRVTGAILFTQSVESDVDSKGQLSRLSQLRKGMPSMNVFSARKGDNESNVKSAEMQTNEDQEVMDVKPVWCLLHDCCAALGASYAEVWIRKTKEGGDSQHHLHRHDSVSVSSDTPVHTHGHRFGSEDPPVVSPARSPLPSVRTSARKTLMQTPSAPKISPPTSPKRHFSMKGLLGETRAPSLKEFTRGPSGGVGSHREKRPSIAAAMGILGIVADDHHAHDGGLMRSNSLTFAGYTYVDEELLESQVKDREQLEGQDWKVVKRQLDALTHSEQLHYEEGIGLPGSAWGYEHLLDWNDLSVLEASDELMQKDQRCVVLCSLFDMSVGIKIMDPTSTFLVGVLILYRTFSAQKKRANRRNFRELSGQASVTDLLKNAGKAMFWCMRLQEASATFLQLREEEAAEQRLSLDEDDSRDVEHKPLMLRVRHWWWKFFKKFRGQKGTPPGKNTWQFSIWTFIGSFITMLIISAVNRSLLSVQFQNDFLFVLINSMGAVTAMLFAAPSSPIVQPRNIFGGHIISAVAGLLVDYLSNPDYLAVLPEWIAVPLAPAVTVLLMAKLGLINPPACACSVIYIAGRPQIKNLGWMYLACPILLDCSIVVFSAVVINNMSKERSYPLFW